MRIELTRVGLLVYLANHYTTRGALKKLGVTSMGEAWCIQMQANEAAPQATYAKALTAKLPQLNLKMTPQQFRKYQIEWEIFVKITNTPK